MTASWDRIHSDPPGLLLESRTEGARPATALAADSRSSDQTQKRRMRGYPATYQDEDLERGRTIRVEADVYRIRSGTACYSREATCTCRKSLLLLLPW
jgi:hypothetical protein